MAKAQWKKEFDAIVKDKHKKLVGVFSKAVKLNASEVVSQTPLWFPNDPSPNKRGFTRGAWTMNKEGDNNNRRGISDVSGRDTKNEAISVVTQNTKNADKLNELSLTFTNNVPWIEKLEYGGYPDPVRVGSWNPNIKGYERRSDMGFSKQAPFGIAAITALQFKNNVDQAKESLNVAEVVIE